jgi:hypothetical protein
MKRLAKSTWIVLILLFVAACGGGAPASPTADAEAIYTAAVETAHAQLTLTAMAVTDMPLATPTSTATPTVSGPTQTPLITNTPLVTNTPFSLTPIGPTQAPCDTLLFLGDVTIPDGTHFAPGEWFDKTWKVQNTGPCEWNAHYAVAYAYGDYLEGDNDKLLGVTVKWGDIIEITVHLRAPSTDGEYLEAFRMVNDRDTFFGTWFFVKIVVP